MSPRKTILRELNSAGPGSTRRPNEIEGFAKQPPKFRQAVNALLRDQLISGSKDSEGNLVIALNEQRLPQVRREIRPWFLTPLTWAVGIGVATLAALVILS